jgi:hypothetical protein
MNMKRDGQQSFFFGENDVDFELQDDGSTVVIPLIGWTTTTPLLFWWEPLLSAQNTTLLASSLSVFITTQDLPLS